MSEQTPNHHESMISSISSADMNLTPVTDLHNLHVNDNDNTNRITETLRKANKGIALSPGLVNDDYKYLDNLPLSAKNSAKKRAELVLTGLESTPKSPLDNPVKSAYNIFDKTQQQTTPMSGQSFSAKSPGGIIKPFSSKKRKTHSKKKQNHPIASASKYQTSSPSSRTNANKQQFQQQHPPTPTIKVIKDILSDPQITKNITNILQILLNTSLIFIFLSILLLSLRSIKKDADLKIQRYVNESNFRIQNCKREYVRNNCDPSIRVPALEYKCLEWENCMYSSIENKSNDVGSTTAYFEIFAECLNAFFHQLSFKSLVGLIVLILSLFIVPNVLFNRFKNSTMSTTTTTTTNNYYHVNGNSNPTNGLIESESLLGSPMRQPQQLLTDNTNQSLYYTPSQHSLSPTKVYAALASGGAGKGGGEPPLQHMPRSETSVRFNPNVSYSFYDVDDEDKKSENIDWERYNQDVLAGDSGSPLVGKYVRNRDKY